MLDPAKINYTITDVARELDRRTESLITVCESQNNMIATLHDRITKLEDIIDNLLENQQ